MSRIKIYINQICNCDWDKKRGECKNLGFCGGCREDRDCRSGEVRFDFCDFDYDTEGVDDYDDNDVDNDYEKDNDCDDNDDAADFPAVFFHISYFDICHEIQK